MELNRLDKQILYSGLDLLLARLVEDKSLSIKEKEDSDQKWEEKVVGILKGKDKASQLLAFKIVDLQRKILSNELSIPRDAVRYCNNM